MGKQIYQVGQQVNSLKLLAFSRSVWTVSCICGQIKNIRSNKLKRSKSCGCLSLFKKAQNSTDPTITRIFNSYKNHAKERNLDWNLSKKQVRELITQNCEYCGYPPFNTSCAYAKNYRQYSAAFLLTNGIDRVNNQIGYNIDNVCSCCKICNRAKSDMRLEDFLSWLKTIGAKYGPQDSGNK